jgi:hypothetical protein
MPPQQGKGLLDLIDGALNFGAHGKLLRPIWSQRPLL